MDEHATCVVGIDVSKRKLDIALLANSKIKSKVFDNTVTGHSELVQWLLERGAEQQRTHIYMEATGPYSEAVAIALVESGWHISVVNPARIKGFAQGELARNKTDRADSSLLARFCAAMRPSLWTPPPAEWRELRGWVDRLQALKDMHQQESNRLEAHTTTGQASLIESVQTHLDWLAQQIGALEHDINDHINRHPELKRDAELLHSIPGIGSITVAKVLAYAGDVRRFKCQGAGGIHRRDATAAFVRQFGQRSNHDESYWPCRLATGFVYAGTGSAQAQSSSSGIWR